MVTEYDRLGLVTISDFNRVRYKIKMHFDTDCLMCDKLDICDGKDPDCYIYKDRQEILAILGQPDLSAKKEGKDEKVSVLSEVVSQV
jgi:hypothetical protein